MRQRAFYLWVWMLNERLPIEKCFTIFLYKSRTQMYPTMLRRLLLAGMPLLSLTLFTTLHWHQQTTLLILTK